MEHKNKSIKDFAYVFFSTSFGQVLRIVRNLVVAGLIGPELFGIIQGLNIFLLYIPVLQLGYFQAANREIPQLIGRNDHDRIRSIEYNGIVVLAASSAAGLLVYTAIFLWNLPELSVVARICWIGFAATLLQQPLGQFYQVLYTAHGQFQEFSRIKVLESLFFFVLLALVVAWGYVGQLVSLAFSAGLLSFLLVKKKPVRLVGLRPDTAIVKEMVSKGYPILLSAMTFNIFYTIDKIFIVGTRGAEEFGYYSIGASVFQVAIFVPESIRLISYRYFNVEYGKDRQNERLRSGFWLSFLIVAIAMWCLSVASYLVLPAAIAFLLPAYSPAIPVLKVFAVTMGLAAPGMMLSTALYSVHRERAVLKVYAGSMALFLAGIAVFINYHLPAVMVAVLISAAHGVSSVALFILVVRQPEYMLAPRSMRTLSAALAGLIVLSGTLIAAMEVFGDPFHPAVAVGCIVYAVIMGLGAFLVFRRRHAIL